MMKIALERIVEQTSNCHGNLSFVSSLEDQISIYRDVPETPTSDALAAIERVNSALAHVKSVKRATMHGEDRLNALVLLFIHKDIQLRYDSIIE